MGFKQFIFTIIWLRISCKKKEFINFFFISATEIRCQEKSKGGLSYEVILAEPLPNVAVPPPVKRNPLEINKNLSAQEIERKLKEAEERRLVKIQII